MITVNTELTAEDCKRLGIKDWELSEEAKREIEKIEENRQLSMLALRRHFS